MTDQGWDLRGSRVLITGGAGLVGSHIADKLVAEDVAEVVVLDNFVRGRASRLDGLGDAIERATHDVRDTDALIGLFAGVDAVFHLAAVNGTENFYNRPQLVLDVGTRGALAVSEACVAAGVADLVVASSAEVYQTPAIVPTDESVPLVLPNSLNPRYSYGGSKMPGNVLLVYEVAK